MKLSTRTAGDVTIIDVDGKLVLGEGDLEIKKAVDAVLDRGATRLLLNLARTPYIDSAGLGEIIRCYTAFRKKGGELKLLSPNERILDLLTITNLLNVFDAYDDEATAVASFA